MSSKNLRLLCLIMVLGIILAGIAGAAGKGSNLVFLTVKKGDFSSSVDSERSNKALIQTGIFCSGSPCIIDSKVEIYYYHTEHLAYDSYYGCGSGFVCQTPIYDLGAGCLDLHDAYYFMIGFDAKPGFRFSDLNIYIDDQDVFFDANNREWYRYEDDAQFFAYLPLGEASPDWDFYLTGYANVSDYLYFPPEGYLPNPDISCYLDCYQLYEDPYCYCDNSKTYACDAYGDLYSYYIDFEDAGGYGSYWSVKNVYIFPLHDSDLYETPLIKFSNISQIEDATLVFDAAGSNPDALYEQGNLYTKVYDKDDNYLGMILDEMITSSVTKNIDIKEFLRDEGIKFLFGNDFGSEYVIENIRIEFAARCSDGTLYGGCSETKPLYCEQGNLMDNCIVCGCPECYACRPNGSCIVWDFQGDVNGDRKVDIFDLAAVGLAYGSQPGDSNWNENADVTGDGKVNIFDLATVGLNYGKSC